MGHIESLQLFVLEELLEEVRCIWYFGSGLELGLALLFDFESGSVVEDVSGIAIVEWLVCREVPGVSSIEGGEGMDGVLDIGADEGVAAHLVSEPVEVIGVGDEGGEGSGFDLLEVLFFDAVVFVELGEV